MRTNNLLSASAIALLLVVSCAEPASPEKKNGTAKNNDTLTKTTPPPPDTLAQLHDQRLQHPLNFGKYKQLNQRMLNCGKGFKGSLWHPAEEGFYYNYCHFNASGADAFNKQLPAFYEYSNFIIWKQGKEIGYYTDTNEVLVAVQCRVQDPRLGIFDLVGKDSSAILNDWGKPHSTLSDRWIFFSGDKLLVIGWKNKRASWFRWLWLPGPLKNISELSEEHLATYEGRNK